MTAVDLEDQEYTIGDEALEYLIPEFAAESSLCKISYTFEVVDSKGETAANFDGESRIFTFESEDAFKLAGKYTVIITGEVGTDKKESESASFNLYVQNPCTLIVPDQENPPEYLYTGSEPQLEFIPEAIEVYPSFCPLSLECEILSGPSLDLCVSREGDDVLSMFDESSGRFILQSSDTSTF